MNNRPLAYKLAVVVAIFCLIIIALGSEIYHRSRIKSGSTFTIDTSPPSYPTPSTPTTANPDSTSPLYSSPPVAGYIYSAINNYRSAAGIDQIFIYRVLEEAAIHKCNDMIDRSYFSHNSPDGQSPAQQLSVYDSGFTMMKENLSSGYTDSAAVFKSWVKNPDSNASLLDTDINYQGIAVCHSDNFMNQGPKYIVVEELVQQ